MILATGLYLNAWCAGLLYDLSISLLTSLPAPKAKSAFLKPGICSTKSEGATHILRLLLTLLSRWGFMVIFWNFSGVPFVSSYPCQVLGYNISSQSYVYSVVYMASHDPSTYKFSTGGYIFIYTVLCTAYYMSVFVNTLISLHI